MSIYRVQKDPKNPYVMINKTVLHDTRLSAKAKGLMAYLLSLPDNWQIYESEITGHFTDGKDSIKSGIRELRQYGYIVRGNRIRNKEGHLKGYKYTVYENPSQYQDFNSYDGRAYVGQPATNNNDKREKVQTLYTEPAQKTRERLVKQEAREEFWENINHKLQKQIEQEA